MAGLKVLDLFSGAGGLSYGFELAGFDVQNAVDFWPDALETLRHNSPNTQTHLIDLGDVEATDIFLSKIEVPDVVIGGPPCQGFSIAGKRDPGDPRNRLYKGFIRAIEFHKPLAFVMENVPTINSPTNRELFNEILNDFKGLGYQVEFKVLLASQYGVPQNRKRMFIVGTRGTYNFEFPREQLNVVTAQEALSDLPERGLEDESPYPVEARSEYQILMRSGSAGISNHQITLHSEKTTNVISHVPDGGNFKDLPSLFQGIRNVNIAWTRLASWKPSFTVDTGHRHHFHYEFNRVPTVRESARLQSFPDSFVFLGGRTSQMKQVGNAVPPLLAKQIAQALLKCLGGKN